MVRRLCLLALAVVGASALSHAQTGPGTADFEAETLRHFQALLRRDTSSPPGNEIRAVEYLKQVLDEEGIPYQVFAKDPERANLVVRIKGNGNEAARPAHGPHRRRDRRPQEVDLPSVRRHASTAATSTAAARSTTRTTSSPALMLILQLKRTGAALDRDVILLAEAGEEGAPDVGAQFMADHHLDGDRRRVLPGRGRRRRAARRQGRAGQRRHHREGAAARRAHRARAGRPRLGALAEQRRARACRRRSARSAHWKPPLRAERDDRRRTSKRLTTMPSPPSRSVPRRAQSRSEGVDGRGRDWMLENEPQHWSMLHTSLVPTIIDARAFATTSFRRKRRRRSTCACTRTRTRRRSSSRCAQVVDDPRASRCAGSRDRYRPAGGSRLDTEAFPALEAQIDEALRHRQCCPPWAPAPPTCRTSGPRAPQCYGIGPAIDTEDGPKGFGAHSDQERILDERAPPLRALPVRRRAGPRAG